MDRRRRSARAAEPPRALRRASIGERRCARYPLAAVRDSLSSPRPSPIRRPPPRLPYSTARRFFRALWLRRSLRDPRLQLPPKRPCPPSGACRQPAFLPVRGEGLATGKCPSRAAAATTHRSAQRPQRTPLPDDGARPGRSAPPSSTLRPGRPLRIDPADSPPPRDTAARSNRSSLEWLAASRSRSISFLSVGNSLTYDPGE